MYIVQLICVEEIALQYRYMKGFSVNNIEVEA